MRYFLFFVLLYMFSPPYPKLGEWLSVIMDDYLGYHHIFINFLLFEYLIIFAINSCTCTFLSSTITINYPWSVRRCPANCESAAILWSCCFTVQASIFCRQSATARSKPSTMLSDWRVSSSATSSSARSKAVSMINCNQADANFILLISRAREKVVYDYTLCDAKIIQIFSSVKLLTR